MQPDALFYLVAGIAVFILGLSKGGFAGVGMISTPLLALLIGPIAAAGVIFPMLIVQDVIAVAMARLPTNSTSLEEHQPNLSHGTSARGPGAVQIGCVVYSQASLRDNGEPAVALVKIRIILARLRELHDSAKTLA